MEEEGKKGALDIGLLVLRVGIGLSFLFAHGGPKLLAGPEKWSGLGQAGMSAFGITFGYTFWGFLAALFETLGGVGLVLGFLLLPSSLMILLVMIPAAALHFGAGEAQKALYPIEIGLVMISLMLTGPGRFSLRRKKKTEAPETQPQESAGEKVRSSRRDIRE